MHYRLSRLDHTLQKSHSLQPVRLTEQHTSRKKKQKTCRCTRLSDGCCRESKQTNQGLVTLETPRWGTPSRDSPGNCGAAPSCCSLGLRQSYRLLASFQRCNRFCCRLAPGNAATSSTLGWSTCCRLPQSDHTTFGCFGCLCTSSASRQAWT